MMKLLKVSIPQNRELRILEKGAEQQDFPKDEEELERYLNGFKLAFPEEGDNSGFFGFQNLLAIQLSDLDDEKIEQMHDFLNDCCFLSFKAVEGGGELCFILADRFNCLKTGCDQSSLSSNDFYPSRIGESLFRIYSDPSGQHYVLSGEEDDYGFFEIYTDLGFKGLDFEPLV